MEVESCMCPSSHALVSSQYHRLKAPAALPPQYYWHVGAFEHMLAAPKLNPPTMIAHRGSHLRKTPTVLNKRTLA
eukprot:2165843-Pyramimonas_sp.AAC.1